MQRACLAAHLNKLWMQSQIIAVIAILIIIAIMIVILIIAWLCE